MKCSRTVPAPMKIWAKRSGSNEKLRYVIYPSLGTFKLACKKCRFRFKEANRYQCALRDPEFDLKYYGMAVGLNGKLWVGTVPQALQSRNPNLYAEAAAFVRRRAGSFRTREYSRPEVDTEGQIKPELAVGKTTGFPGSGVSQDVSGVSG